MRAGSPLALLASVLLLVGVVVLVRDAATGPAADRYRTYWVEGEHPVAHDVNRHVWYDQVDTTRLSGGGWLSHFHSRDGAGGEAQYSFDLDRAGRFTLYLRLNPERSGYALRWNDGPWRAVDLEPAFEVLNIAADGALDMRFVGWIDAGEVPLAAGRHTLTIRIDGELNHHGAIDAIVLTETPQWTPPLRPPRTPE